MGEVTVKVKTNGKAGEKILKKVTIYTDDPKNPKIDITLTGNVIPAADIEPKAARLMGNAGEKIQADIKITPPKNNMFDITEVKAEEGRNIRFQLEKMNKSGSRFFILHVSNIKPDASRYFDKITLKTTSTISPELTVRVFGIIRYPSEKHESSEK